MSTEAYVDLMFAWGHARLGDVVPTQRLIEEGVECCQQVSASSEESELSIRKWLVDAFSYRIKQAVNKQPHDGPLPADLQARLDGGSKSKRFRDQPIRYAIDVLRYISRILEPSESIDPYQPWLKWARATEDTTKKGAHTLVWRSPVLNHPNLESARTYLDEYLKDPQLRRVGQSLAIGGFVTFLGQIPWNDRAAELQQLIGRLPRCPNTFTTTAHYSRAHLAIIDRIVLAIAGDSNARTDSTVHLPPASEFASRREALVEARARLVEWGRPDWGPAFRSS